MRGRAVVPFFDMRGDLDVQLRKAFELRKFASDTLPDPLRTKKISPRAKAAFLLSVIFCSFLVGVSIRNKSEIERMTMEHLIMEKSIKIAEVVSKLLYKTQALSALVIQGDGAIVGFERVAATVADDPAILNILIAPGGVVSDVYPLAGNERLIGFDLLVTDDAGNAEARMAVERDQLVFGGPFNLMQGGRALVGRLPVWMTRGGVRSLWGLVSVTLKYPQVLDGAGLGALEKQGFAYEIWRVNPDDGKRQIISSSSYDYNQGTRFIERHIPILNADWYFRVSPVFEWYQYPENWVLILMGLLISFMMAYIVQNNTVLREIRRRLERLVRTDVLTGALNRQGFLHALGELIRAGGSFTLCYLDLNYFKHINDTYGHIVGDRALVAFSRKVCGCLDDGCTFGRMSGDEFVLICPGEGEVPWAAINAEMEGALEAAGELITLSFSKGCAIFPRDGVTADELISCADRRMYEEKNLRYAKEKRRRRTDHHPTVKPPSLT